MANWGMDKSLNYQAEQAERVAVFNRIKPRDNWKMPISAWIHGYEFEECNQAAIWFTGSPLTVVARAGGGKQIRVEAPGYYETVGA